VSAETFNEIKQDYSADVAAGIVSPTGPALPTQTVSEVAPVFSPVVTDLDLVNQVGTQTPPAVGATELERVIVQGQREANVAPVVTDLERVTVGEPYDSSPTVPPAPEPPAPPPDKIEVKTEEPKKEEEPKEKPKEEPKKYYPTVTTVPPPKRPGRQPIIMGESPSRLLADSLAAYRPAGAIEGEESGKERQNVWNEKSLRLKDALGL
jgi:outer membrane biosynthesis protein TonB